jgi:glycerophosphoryl diester phosphodiesterase
MSVPIDVLAHRGCAVAHRENTTAAFAEAVRVGADGIELDVRSSADGRLVVHHDPLLPDGRVVGRTHSTAFPDYVPLLGEALDACDGLLVNVEVKSDPSEPGFVAGEATARATVRALAARSRASPTRRPP